MNGKISTESANKAFWLQMTKESSIPYCIEMLKLSTGYGNCGSALHSASDNDVIAGIEAYMDYVVDMTEEGKRMKAAPEKSPFPSDLLGFIRRGGGERCFEPSHLMCRLGILRDEEEHISYEFLIEYDIFRPDVEIYYGVKAVSDSEVTTPEFQQKVIFDWQKVRRFKKYVSLANKFKVTNNGDNGTFWPFWLRVNLDRQNALVEAVKNLSMFYDDYQKNLKLTVVGAPKFIEVNENLLKCSQSPEDYVRLLNVVGKRFGAEGKRLFENVFVKNCIKKGYIEKCGEATYYVTGIPNYRFIYLMRLFFMGMSYLFGEGQIPQKELSCVFLGRKKRYLTSSDWGKSENDMSEVWDKCDREVKEWLSLS